MTSHVHMIIGTTDRPLEKTIGEMKSHTSGALRKAIETEPAESRKEWLVSMMKNAGLKNNNNRGWQLWQQHNQPIVIVDEGMFYRALNYIHCNPVQAGFVANEEDWLYSSARDFHEQKGLIELSYIM